MKRSNLLLPSCICLICMILFLTACQKEIEKLPVQEENSLFTEAEVAILSNYLDLTIVRADFKVKGPKNCWF